MKISKQKKNERRDFFRAEHRGWTDEAPLCLNCGRPGSHYVPPSLGEEGFFICVAKETREAVLDAVFEPL